MSPQNHPEPLSGNEKSSGTPRKHTLLKHPGARSALAVGRALLEKGHQAVIAGGAVRDLLMGGEPKDFDIATNAHPEEVLACFRRTRKVGIAFGVVLVNDFGETVEVATFRTDLEYLDGRRPEGVVFTDAKNDAQRRDFTVNGLFLDLESFKIVDHVGGQSDLEAGVLRAIGDPERRFAEDYLRMLRAVRFSVRLNFEIEANTAAVIKKKVGSLKDIAADRIHEELARTFSVEQSDRALKLLNNFGMLEVLFEQPTAPYELPPDHRAQEGGDYSAVLSLLLRNRGRSQLDRDLKALRSTNEEKKCIQGIVRALSALPNYLNIRVSQKKRLLRDHSRKHLLFLIHRCPELDEARKTIEHDLLNWSQQDLYPPILPSGQDLLEKGYTPGPHIGKILDELEDLLLEGSIVSKEEVEAHLEKR